MIRKPLRSADMNVQVRIEANVRAENGRGGATRTWTKVATVWARKVPLRGDELTRDGVVRSVSFARFLVRYRPDVTAQHRLIVVVTNAGAEQDVGLPWDIKRVDDPLNSREQLEIDCEQGLPA